MDKLAERTILIFSQGIYDFKKELLNTICSKYNKISVSYKNKGLVFAPIFDHSSSSKFQLHIFFTPYAHTLVGVSLSQVRE